jgi:Uma2 family endonuclease
MLSIDAWLDEKPHKELYDGVVHEKVSPQRIHAKIELRIGRLLEDWGGDRGDVGSEWRVYLAEGTTLVPDVAFFSNERLAPLSESEREKPPFAPDIAVEVRSPEDRERNIRRKTVLYLAHGARLVLDVDPFQRTVRVSNSKGEVTLHARQTLQHHAFPDLQIPVSEIFAPLDRKM